MQVSIKTTLDEITHYLDDVAKNQMPFATALALTQLAKQGDKDLKAEFKRSFDRPTPYTMRSTYVKPAQKRDAAPHAIIGIKDQAGAKASRSPAELLEHQFKGGQRTRSRLEYWLAKAGYITPGEWVAPGQEARLDRYGNISRGQVQQIISQLRAGPDARAYASNSKRSKRKRGKRGGLFWSRGGRLARGVWMRDGGDVVPIIIVVRAPKYTKAIDLDQVITRSVNKHARQILDRAIGRAIATAR